MTMQLLGSLSVVLGVAVVVAAIVEGGATQGLTHWDTDWGPQPEDPTDFTTFLWYGYSSNKVNFTREDFKQLLECTSGHHQCPHLSMEPPLSALTDCVRNTALTSSQCRMLDACSEDDLLAAYGLKERSLGVKDLRVLLPAVRFMAHRRKVCNTTPGSTNSKPKPSEVWGYGILFVTLISGCSLAGVSVLPVMAHNFYQQVLTLLVGLAVGSLAASSLFHLIPQTGHHDYLLVSLFVLLGIWSFFMIERLIKIIVTHQSLKEERAAFPACRSDQAILCRNGRDVQSPDYVESGSIGKNSYDQGSIRKNSYDQDGQGLETAKSLEVPEVVTPESSCITRDVGMIYASQQQVIRASFGHNERPRKTQNHSHSLEFRQGKDSVIRTVAWMIIFGDGFHNFIDGVSIGAAFSESILTGISISLAVMCEELPHELGDFAVLLNAGMTMRQAVAYNFLSATTCYLGLCLGIVLGEFTQDTTAIFAVAAGMFLYIALVDMVPEMNEVASKAAEGGWKPALKILFFQNIGIFIGISSLFCLAYFQESMVLT